MDAALWNLKAKLLDLPLHELLGAVREEIPIYGSGGFISYTDDQLRQQLEGDAWIDFIQARHEELAAFIACAHSKFTGEVGVCIATSGPGAIHLLNGLYDAYMDHQGVVAIVGQQATIGLGAGVVKALLGKAVLPDDLPYVTGAIGLLGTQPSWALMHECDTLFMIGTSFPYAEFLPEEGQARGVQIDIRARNLSLRYPTEVPLEGDSRETLEALIPLLERKSDRGWRERVEENVREWWQVLEARAMNDAEPINPQRVLWELSPRLPDRCILTSDSGSSANWWARDLKVREGMMASLSGNRATMGPGVPYAIAAKFAHPDRPVIACVGDGAMQINGLNDSSSGAESRAMDLPLTRKHGRLSVACSDGLGGCAANRQDRRAQDGC